MTHDSEHFEKEVLFSMLTHDTSHIIHSTRNIESICIRKLELCRGHGVLASYAGAFAGAFKILKMTKKLLIFEKIGVFYTNF